MESALLIIAVVLTLIGLAGCILPGLPGPPLNFLAIICLQFAFKPFSVAMLVLSGILTLLVIALEFYMPVWTAKRFGATKLGIWGSVIGMLLGIFLTPIGMIGGLLLGAIIGDMMAGHSIDKALFSGVGTLAGTLFSLFIKLVASGIMTFLVFVEVTRHILS